MFASGKERKNFELLGYQTEGKPWTDERLGMTGQFMIGEQMPRLELVAPHGNQSPVASWLKQGTKIYHMGYLAQDLVGEIERLRAQRAKVMLPPTPAVAFAEARVCFLMLPNLLLIELIEKR